MRKYTVKKWVSLLVVLILMLSVLPQPSVAAATEASQRNASSRASGICGNNLYWNLSTDGVLTIYGTGAMYNYFLGSTYASPWYAYRSYINRVVVEEGVTTIGEYAFYANNWITSVTIPKSVKSISDDAFHNCERLAGIWVDTEKYFPVCMEIHIAMWYDRERI